MSALGRYEQTLMEMRKGLSLYTWMYITEKVQIIVQEENLKEQGDGLSVIISISKLYRLDVINICEMYAHTHTHTVKSLLPDAQF